ncbi:conserved exported hypothetical protein [Tenacibaculum sp. 190524A05c]|uniref:DUF6770 family protein n=1 Tax=Tenacibaculum platacis TaxID=3137852 RepID=UPI0031FB633B
MRKLLYVLLFVGTYMVSAQSKTIENMVKFKVKDSGSFINDANDVDGYYFFYEVDKLKKGMREYAVQILDKNLNDIALKKFVASKRSVMVANAFNNDAIMFALFNKKEKTLTLKSFDKKANPREDVVVSLDKKLIRIFDAGIKAGSLNTILHPVKGKGFVLITSNFEGKGTGYSLNFYPTNESEKEWEFKFVPEEKRGHHIVTPIAINDNFIVLIDVKSKRMSKKKEFKTIVLDANTGVKLFDKPYDENDPKLISNAFISSDGKISVMGQYYKPKAKIAKAQSLGLYTENYNDKGEVLFSKRISWQEDVSKFLPVKENNKLEDIGYIFFHEIIKTESGEYYAIGEQYKKTLSAFGMATATLSAFGGGVQTSGFTQLTIKDIYVFKFDKEFNLKGVDKFEKGKSRVPNLVDFGSPQFNAYQVAAFGGFDFVYSQRDVKRDRFYANFIDYERGGKKKKKNKGKKKSRFVFKTIIQDGGELSVDNIELPKQTRYFRVLPAKVGYVLLLEYDRKKKSSSLRMEKLNIN